MQQKKASISVKENLTTRYKSSRKSLLPETQEISVSHNKQWKRSNGPRTSLWEEEYL